MNEKNENLEILSENYDFDAKLNRPLDNYSRPMIQVGWMDTLLDETEMAVAIETNTISSNFPGKKCWFPKSQLCRARNAVGRILIFASAWICEKKREAGFSFFAL